MNSKQQPPTADSPNVRRHFAWVTATVVTMAVCCVGSFAGWSTWSGAIRDRFSDYHVASLQQLDEMEDILDSAGALRTAPAATHQPSAPGSVQYDHRIEMLKAFYRVRKSLDKLAEIHTRFREPVLDLPYQRLERVVLNWDGLLQGSGKLDGAQLTACAIEIGVRVEQLESFHRVLHFDLSQDYEETARTAAWALICGLAAILTLGGTVSLRLYQSLNAILRTQEETTVELADARARADAANEAKTAFLANMSHEIRTPMTGMMGFAEQLLDPNLTEGEKLEAAQIIRQSGKHLLGVINDILDLAKLEAGRMAMKLVACNPTNIATSVVETFSSTARSKGLKLTMELAGPIPYSIQSDPIRLRQILFNLVGNALKFTSAGSVTVIIRRDDDKTMVYDIIDTGAGMSSQQAETLFQPFTQLTSGPSGDQGGTGLGLVISRRFAQLLGGDVRILHTAPGEGSCFRVTVATGNVIDVAPPDDSPLSEKESTEMSHEPSQRRLQGISVLCAEDNTTIQLLIRRILEKEGADVRIVSNGKEAVELLRPNHFEKTASDDDYLPDVIVLDMEMPVMNGYAAAAALRASGCKLPIIALTANASAADAKKCLAAGCDEHLTKPIDCQTIVSAILSHLQTGVTT